MLHFYCSKSACTANWDYWQLSRSKNIWFGPYLITHCQDYRAFLINFLDFFRRCLLCFFDSSSMPAIQLSLRSRLRALAVSTLLPSVEVFFDIWVDFIGVFDGDSWNSVARGSRNSGSRRRREGVALGSRKVNKFISSLDAGVALFSTEPVDSAGVIIVASLARISLLCLKFEIDNLEPLFEIGVNAGSACAIQKRRRRRWKSSIVPLGKFWRKWAQFWESIEEGVSICYELYSPLRNTSAGARAMHGFGAEVWYTIVSWCGFKKI